MEIVRAVQASGGGSLTVSEAEIGELLRRMVRQGFYIEPTSAATTAGVAQYLRGAERDERIVSVYRPRPEGDGKDDGKVPGDGGRDQGLSSTGLTRAPRCRGCGWRSLLAQGEARGRRPSPETGQVDFERDRDEVAGGQGHAQFGVGQRHGGFIPAGLAAGGWSLTRARQAAHHQDAADARDLIGYRLATGRAPPPYGLGEFVVAQGQQHQVGRGQGKCRGQSGR